MLTSFAAFDAEGCDRLRRAIGNAEVRRLAPNVLRSVISLNGGKVHAQGQVVAVEAFGLRGEGLTIEGAARVWASEAETALHETELRAFLALHADAPLGDLTDALKDACRKGWGLWLDPGIGHRPATHMVEIGCYSVLGTGLTEEEAARSWRRAAINRLNVEEAAA